MKASISVQRRDGREMTIKIDQDGQSIELYRSEEKDHYTVVDTGDEIHVTEIRDGEVSRRVGSNGESYIEIFKEQQQIFVTDHGSTNDTLLRDGLGEESLTANRKYPIERDSSLFLSPKEDSRVTIETTSASISPTWELVSTEIQAFEAILETGNVERLDDYSEKLNDHLKYLHSNEDVGEDFTDIYEEYQSLRRNVVALTESPDQDTEKMISKGKRVSERLKGAVDRYSLHSNQF